MIILGIESSCDETAVSVIDSNEGILSNVIMSQMTIHAPYRGVVPELAARNHLFTIDKSIFSALNNAGKSLDQIDIVSATAGPGLIGGLLVGLTVGKIIAQSKSIPFVAVNHLEAHALTIRLTNKITFPYLLLLISGGHSEFYIIKDINNYIHLGGTIDDALGEAFDKTARILGLKFPGGAYLEKLAINGNAKKYDLPRPLVGKAGLNFSFSGLKSAAARIKENYIYDNNANELSNLAASFQKAVSDILCDRIKNAFKIFKNLCPYSKSFVVSGGVASNNVIRKEMKIISQVNNFEVYFPPANLCTDNGVMVAWAGYERYRKGLISNLDFTARPRWPLQDRVD